MIVALPNPPASPQSAPAEVSNATRAKLGLELRDMDLTGMSTTFLCSDLKSIHGPMSYPTNDISDSHCVAKDLLDGRNTKSSIVYLHPRRRYRKRSVLTSCCKVSSKRAAKEASGEGMGQAIDPPSKPSTIVVITSSRFAPDSAPKSTLPSNTSSSRKTTSTLADTSRTTTPSSYRRTTTSGELRRDAMGPYATPKAIV